MESGPSALADRSKHVQEARPNPFWISDNTISNNDENGNEAMAYSENPRLAQQLVGEQLPQVATDPIEDTEQREAVPLFYLQNKK